MEIFNRRTQFYLNTFVKHDFRASISVFFVALPLCLGVSLASNTPVYSGLIAGIIGGILIGFISGSQLSVSGPAAGLTAICAAAITELGALEIFFLSVSIAGMLQIMLGIFKLGGFTHFIPSAVIKGMLAAIGIILISKQIPLLLGYDRPDFWTKQLFNIFTFKSGFSGIVDFANSVSVGALLIAASSLVLLILWRKFFSRKISFIPTSFITVVFGVCLAYLLEMFLPQFQLKPSQFVNIPGNIFSEIRFPQFSALFTDTAIWKNAVVICFVATLETLLSIEAIDKLDPYNRISPQNRELVAQGTGNFISGLLGGIPITAVIVRSSANVEAGGKTKFSTIAHGVWLVLAILFAVPLINRIPYCVLAVILIRTGYNLAKPKLFIHTFRSGREQFYPFLITVGAILFSDILIGVLIGIAYSVYFIVKHTYRAGYTIESFVKLGITTYRIDLAMNVSFLNKKKLMDELDNIPAYSVVEIIGTGVVYIDHDILEIIHDYRLKAYNKHIELKLINVPYVDTIVPDKLH